MPKPSAVTVSIREFVGRMQDEELKTHGPTYLKQFVEGLGYKYLEVRDKINNELHQARRKRGIRKGQGRKILNRNYSEYHWLLEKNGILVMGVLHEGQWKILMKDGAIRYVDFDDILHAQKVNEVMATVIVSGSIAQKES